MTFLSSLATMNSPEDRCPTCHTGSPLEWAFLGAVILWSYYPICFEGSDGIKSPSKTLYIIRNFKGNRINSPAAPPKHWSIQTPQRRFLRQQHPGRLRLHRGMAHSRQEANLLSKAAEHLSFKFSFWERGFCCGFSCGSLGALQTSQERTANEQNHLQKNLQRNPRQNPPWGIISALDNRHSSDPHPHPHPPQKIE